VIFRGKKVPKNGLLTCTRSRFPGRGSSPGGCAGRPGWRRATSRWPTRSCCIRGTPTTVRASKGCSESSGWSSTRGCIQILCIYMLFAFIFKFIFFKWANFTMTKICVEIDKPEASLEDVLAANSLCECYPMTSGWHCLKNSFIGCQIRNK
jgi:hypothetical protein